MKTPDARFSLFAHLLLGGTAFLLMFGIVRVVQLQIAPSDELQAQMGTRTTTPNQQTPHPPNRKTRPRWIAQPRTSLGNMKQKTNFRRAVAPCVIKSAPNPAVNCMF